MHQTLMEPEEMLQARVIKERCIITYIILIKLFLIEHFIFLHKMDFH